MKEVEKLVSTLKKYGFEVSYNLEAKEILIKGEIERVDLKGYPMMTLMNERSRVSYDDYAGYSMVSIIVSDKEEITFVLGKSEDITAIYQYPYLKIRY
jgi:hypothetical protein